MQLRNLLIKKFYFFSEVSQCLDSLISLDNGLIEVINVCFWDMLDSQQNLKNLCLIIDDRVIRVFLGNSEDNCFILGESGFNLL